MPCNHTQIHVRSNPILNIAHRIILGCAVWEVYKIQNRCWCLCVCVKVQGLYWNSACVVANSSFFTLIFVKCRLKHAVPEGYLSVTVSCNSSEFLQMNKCKAWMCIDPQPLTMWMQTARLLFEMLAYRLIVSYSMHKCLKQECSLTVVMQHPARSFGEKCCD